MIRELRDEDVPAVVAVERSVLPPEFFVTEAYFRHELRASPERALQQMWVAVDGGEITGRARAFFRLSVADAGATRIAVAVRPDRRGRGLGASLYDVAEGYVRANGATRAYVDVISPEGERFARARGFEVVAQEHFSSIEPARADVSGLPRLEAALAAEGFRLAPLRELGNDRLRELWALDVAATLDVPSDTVRIPVPYEEWLPQFADPDLDDEGSFLVFHRERPVAYALLAADRGTGRAVNSMTGTLPEYRRRGLARLVKLAVLRWARDVGIRSIWTGNDAENAGMLALNDELGYRRFITGTELAKGL